MPDKYHTDVRLQLLALGYAIIPNRGKMPMIKGWNERGYTAQQLVSGPKGSGPERVASWPGRFPDALSTGVRIENGQCVIDADVDDNDVMTQFWADLAAIAPDVAARAPTRFGGGEHKVALFCRVEGEKWTRIASRRYNGHCIEIFGGATLANGKCSRQFGVYGPHSFNEDGSVARMYEWALDVPALAQVGIGEQPAITIAQAHALVDAFERAAQAAGWVPEAQPDTAGGTAVYDIDENTRFDVNTGSSGLTYDELADELAVHGERLRCSSSFMAGREGTNRERCWVFYSPWHDCTAVFVYGDEQTHYPKQFAPTLERVADHLKALQQDAAQRPQGPQADVADGADAPLEPPAEAGVAIQAQWLLASFGYCAIDDAVIALWEASGACRLRPAAFERRYKAWFEPPEKPRKTPIFATALWEMSAFRAHVTGVRMRPDMPFPLFAEGGALFKNIYRKPVHPAEGGAIEPFQRFLARFLPDPVEREWLLDWMAHKWLRPEVPGSAVVFVADNVDEVREGQFGTGRGLMFRIAHALYGPQYARAQAFNVLDGSSSQSGFTDWMHGSVLVTVDESRTSPTAYRRGERNAVYDVLKDIVDPAPKRMTFKIKYGQAFDAMSYCSFWVATNHMDAVAMPASDRRFTVLRNGQVITPEEAIEIDAWMRDPASIGALVRYLEARQLAGFNMFAPLVTAGKAEMAELALSEVEDILRDMAADDSRGLVFTRAHLMAHVSSNFGANTGKWHGEFEGAWHRYCVKAVSRESGSQRRIRAQGTTKKLFCFRSRAKQAAELPEAAARREASKWGQVDGVTRLPGLSVVPGHNEKDEDDQ